MVEKGLLSGEPVMVILDRERRTILQNKKLWPMLTDVSNQVIYHGKRYNNDDWKMIFTGGLRKLEYAPCTTGKGLIQLGSSTSVMNKKEFSELIEFIYEFGARHDVAWSEPSKEGFNEFGMAA